MKGVSGCIDGQGFKFGQVMSVDERGCGGQMPSGMGMVVGEGDGFRV